MKLKLFIVLLLLKINVIAQNTYRATIRDKTTNENVVGAVIQLQGTKKFATSDRNGEVLLSNIPDSIGVITITFFGYETVSDTVLFPSNNKRIVYMAPESKAMDEVIVEGTRSNKSIDDIPTRVEILNEEIDEASTMDPSKVAHLLTHSTGIQVQQTSATSNMANVRIQGMDGRYTQILKDGFPNYGGFSGGLSIMQIPPLDLKQVEYIKGSSSTLYGAGAISGLINLISKEANKDETLLHINASHLGAFDVNAFLSRKIDKIGFSLLAQRNTHQYFDADKDGFTDLPQLSKYNFNPKLFLYFNSKTKLSIGATFTSELREGGDIQLLSNQNADSVNFYKEKNDINRITTQLKFETKLNDLSCITIRNSFNIFNRGLEITPSYLLGKYVFAGKQLSSFSEMAYTRSKKENVFIAGVNFYSDEFNEEIIQSTLLRNEDYQTIGGFANYTFNLGKNIAIESGIRADHVLDKKTYILPRLSTLFKWTKKLTTRIGGGMGYRNASIFNQEAELLGYKNVLPIDKNKTVAEQSIGGNADVGYKTSLGENFFLNINQMFFFTRLNQPLMLVDTGSSSGIYHFINLKDGYTQSYGTETLFKLSFYKFVLFVGYTYTQVSNISNGKGYEFTLTPKHSIKGDLLYSLPNKWRIGFDYEYKSSQLLSNGKRSRDYWTYGSVIEYTYKNYTVFVNVENLTNFRQTNFESLQSNPYSTPQFTQIWAPLDGIVINGGFKIRL